MKDFSQKFKNEPSFSLHEFKKWLSKEKKKEKEELKNKFKERIKNKIKNPEETS